MVANIVLLEAKVESLGRKCAEFTAENGKDSPQLLLEYGQALFTLARNSASLVDSQKVDEKNMPLENPKVKTTDYENDVSDDINTGDDESNLGHFNEESDDPIGIKVRSGRDADRKEENKDSENQDNVQVNQSEDEDDFVAAFQVVDAARVLLEKELAHQPHKSTMLLLSRTRELLGDISLEDDNAGQAIEDYTEAVRLKIDLFGPESGEVSGAQFVLALAYEANQEPELAIKPLNLAAKAAELAGLTSAAELRQRADDLSAELKQAQDSRENDMKTARKTTADSISGRSALSGAVNSLVAGANDISQLTRKRKRTSPHEKRGNPSSLGK